MWEESDKYSHLTKTRRNPLQPFVLGLKLRKEKLRAKIEKIALCQDLYRS